MPLNIIIITLLLAAIMSLILAVFIWRRRKILGIPALLGLLLSIALWSVASGLGYSVNSLIGKNFFTLVCYIGIVQLPVWFFLFTCEYTGVFGKVSGRLRFILWIVPIVSIIGVITNPLHQQFFTSSVLVSSGELIYHMVEFGLWWWVHTAYSYLMIISAFFLLFQMFLVSSSQQRTQVLILVASSSIPFIFNVLYISGFKPYGFVDLTPVAFAVTGILFFWGMYSRNLFSVKPFALNTLFANLPDGIVVLDNEQNIVDINPSACRMLAMSDSQLKGYKLSKVFPMQIDQDTLAHNTQCEVILDGVTAELSMTPMKNHSGQIAGSLMILRDITDRKLAESELKSTRDRFELAIIAAGLDPWENNLVTGERFGGEKIYQELGYSKDENPRSLSDIFSLIHPDDLKLVQQQIKKHLDGITEIYTSDFRVKDKKGNYQWVTNFGRVVERDSEGNAVRFIGLTLNINDRKRIEEKIRRQNEELVRAIAEKDKFFSIIAHDLRGPFQGFIGLTELMSESITQMSKEEIKDLSQTLQGTAKNLYELLENLLNWALVKRGHKRFNAEKIRLSAIIEIVIETFSYQVNNKNQRVINSVESLFDVLADRESLKTILRNLLSNAIKFTPKGGSITITCLDKLNGFVEVSIADSGIGMSKDMVDNLFNVNKKNSRPGTENEPSTGLGLILCKELIEKHGGRIWAESEVGKGSTFTFTLPLAD